MINIKQTKHFHKNKDRYEPFLKVISTYLEQIHSSPKELHTGLQGGLDMALRIMTGSHASYVSLSLLEKLNKSNLTVNPFTCIWEHRHKMKILVNNKIEFPVWEHTIPISEFRKNLISLRDLDKIESYILDYPGVAWITKEEDKRLNSLKYHKSRPNGFWECYDHAKIRLVNEEYYSGLNN